MKITIVTVGKIKEKYLRDAIAEYTKRLSKYCKLEIVEVADEKTPDNASAAIEDGIRQKEGERHLTNSPRGERAMPSEIAEAIFFLANSRNIIGEILVSDGGNRLN